MSDWDRYVCPWCTIERGERGRPNLSVNGESGYYECFAGATRVITRKGVRAIATLSGGRHEILTQHKGRAAANHAWVLADFWSAGERPLYEVTISRNGVVKTIQATKGHRWLVTAGKDKKGQRAKTTIALKPRDRLASCCPRGPARHGGRPTRLSPFGVARGFTFGDGTRWKKESRAYVNPDKDTALLPFFRGYPRYRRSQKTKLGITNEIMIVGLPGYFKSEKPALGEEHSYLYGWLAGYFAADGSVTPDGTVVLASSRKASLRYVRDLCTELGIFTSGVRRYRRLGCGTQPSDIFYVTLSSLDLTPEFFILEHHRRLFTARAKMFERRHWVVRSVKKLGVSEEVFCCTVPGTGTFTLEDHILVGNCHRCGEKGFVQHLRRAEEPEVQELLGELRRLPVVKKKVEPPPDSWLPQGFQEVSPRGFDISCMAVWRYMRQARKLPRDVIEKARVGFCTQWPLYAVFPMQDETGYVVRSTVPGQSGYIFSKGFPRRTALYDPFRTLGKKGITLYIVEGTIDVLAPGPGTIATLGKGITDAQIDRLVDEHPGLLVAAYDGDSWRENLALARRIKLRGGKAGWIRLPAGKDPGDLGKDLFKYGVKLV